MGLHDSWLSCMYVPNIKTWRRVRSRSVHNFTFSKMWGLKLSIPKMWGLKMWELCTTSHFRYTQFLDGYYTQFSLTWDNIVSHETILSQQYSLIEDCVEYYSTVPALLGKFEVDLGLCAISVHANRKPPCIGIFVSQNLWPNTFFNRVSPPAAACLFAGTEVVHNEKL